MNILTVLLWLKSHWKTVIKAICAASVAFLLLWGCNTHKQNIKLSQELEMAQNNIEAYQGLLDSSWQANNVLRLDIANLQNEKDKALHRVDSIRKLLKLKPKTVSIAATQSQVINVNDSKGVEGDMLTILKDTVYKDSIMYNPLTTVYYTIGTDTVNIGLKVENDQYLYIYTNKQYKNPNKNFIQRLFTWDWKKVDNDKYKIYNTNDLIKTDNIRIVKEKAK